MERRTDELPVPSGERTLSMPEINRFRDEVLWPSVNFLSCQEFSTLSKPGDKFELRFRESRMPYRYTLQAYTDLIIDLGYDKKDQLENRHLSIGLQKMHSRRTSKALEVANAGKKVDEKIPEDANVRLWEVVEYKFNTENDDIFQKFQRYELQDEEGITLWDDRFLSQNIKGDIALEPDIQKTADDLNGVFATSATNQDCLMMRRILQGLKVPQELLELNFH